MYIQIKRFRDFTPEQQAGIYKLRVGRDSIIQERLDNTRLHNICVVAFVGGDPVGLCLLNHGCRYIDPNHIEFNVYVKRGYRNRGIGTEIMKVGREYARKRWPRKIADYYLHASQKLMGIWDRHPEVR